ERPSSSKRAVMPALNNQQPELEESALNIAQAAQKLFSADLGAVQALNPITGRFYGRAVLTSTAALSGTSVQDSLKEIAERAISQGRSEEHTSELQSQSNLVCRLLLEKKKKNRSGCHQSPPSG